MIKRTNEKSKESNFLVSLFSRSSRKAGGGFAEEIIARNEPAIFAKSREIPIVKI